jgi:hypothetical protein
MKTFTRTPTLEAANESGRHAANAILEHFKERVAARSAQPEEQPAIVATPIAAGAHAQFKDEWSFPEAKRPPIDEPCLVRNPEDHELPELAKLKRIDAWCFARDLPHPWDLLGVEVLPSLMSWAPRAEPGGPETPLAAAVRAFVEKGPSWSGEETLILLMKCIREELEARMPGASAQGSGSSGENRGDVAAKVGGEHGQP